MENISKQVLLQTGKKVGYILDVALNGLDKVGYYVVDEDTETEYLLKDEDIKSVSSNFVLAQDGKMEFVGIKNESLIGKMILDEQCNYYGTIESLEFRKNKCQKIITEFCEILPKQVKEIGQDVVFISFKRSFKKMKKPAFAHTEIDIPVKIQSQPEKIVLSSKFYIGKISTEDIFGYNKEKIVLKNEVVTKQVVEKAKLHNKLNQLFFALKR